MKKILCIGLFLSCVSGKAVNAQTNFEWSLFAGGTASSTIIKTVIDSQNNIYGLGNFWSGDMTVGGITYPESQTSTGHFVIKVSSQGNVDWVFTDIHNGQNIIVDDVGLYIAAPDTIYRLDPATGSAVWKSPIKIGSGSLLPSVGFCQKSNGNLYFSFQYSGEDLIMQNLFVDDPNFSTFLVLGEMSYSNGDVIWANKFEYPSQLGFSSNKIQLISDSNDDIYLCSDLDTMGSINLNNGIIIEFDPSTQSRGDFIAKFNLQGDALWSKTITGPDTTGVGIQNISISPDESIIHIAGIYYHTGIYGPNTNGDWGFSIDGFDVEQNCNQGENWSNHFYLSIDSNGNITTNHSFNTCADNYGLFMYENTNNDRYIIGNFKGSMLIDTVTLDNPGTESISYLAKYNSSGNVYYAYEMPYGLQSALNNDLEFFPGGPLLISGSYTDSTRSNQRLMFIGKTQSASQSITNLSVDKRLDIYPNPSEGMITIVHPFTSATWEIIDVSGKMMLSGSASTTSLHLDLSSLSDGFYVVKLYSVNGETRYATIIRN